MKKLYTTLLACAAAVAPLFAQETATPEADITIPGTLNIVMVTDTVAQDQPSTLLINYTSPTTCTFTLPNLTVESVGNLGDITLKEVSMTQADGITSFAGSETGMLLYDNAIDADAQVTGTINANHQANFVIDVTWVLNRGSKYEQRVPIAVTFAGEAQYNESGLTGITLHQVDTPYFNLQGRQVANPGQGIFIHNGRTIRL